MTAYFRALSLGDLCDTACYDLGFLIPSGLTLTASQSDAAELNGVLRRQAQHG
jgi:hypothetical protein